MTELNFLEACYVFDYDPKTGELRWAIDANSRARKGTLAGKVGVHRYLRVAYRGVRYRVQRVVWLMAYGRWPDGYVDHINGDRLDNRLENLRCVPPRVNSQNQRRPHKTNLSGHMGVSLVKGRWLARIRIEAGQIYLGTYPSAEEAGAAYLEAKRRLHEGCTI